MKQILHEHIVLVTEENIPIGTAEKLATHNQNTPLHRGISLFLFDPKGNLLLQQRSHQKKTWPGVWSNSCCGHPMMDETPIQTAKRRLKHELGITQSKIKVILPDYRYKFQHKGIYENELCSVMVGTTSQQPTPNPDEVEAVKWITWTNWLNEVKQNPQNYSEWCIEETNLLNQNKKNIYFSMVLLRTQYANQKLPSK